MDRVRPEDQDVVGLPEEELREADESNRSGNRPARRDESMRDEDFNPSSRGDERGEVT
jgi:hypothetical protein